MEEKTKKKETSTCYMEREKKSNGIKEWKKPTLEDVSGKVMAQPYIRFT